MAQVNDGNNVTPFPPPPEAPIKLKDEWVFRAICEWRIERAKQQIAWSENSRDSLEGRREAPLDISALDSMKTKEYHLSSIVPKTVLTARALLGMAVEIMAYEGIDPEATLAEGPVLDIVRNCLKAFDALDGLTSLERGRECES